MRSQSLLTFSRLFMAFLVVAVWSEAVTPQPQSRPESATESGTVSGKISSVGDGSFSLDVRKSQDLVTMHFFFDDSTKISGKLQVGAIAKVVSYSGDNNKIAVRVLAQAAGGP